MDFQSCDFNLSQENDVWIWIIISCCWKKNWKNGRNHQPHFKCFQVHLLLKSQLFDKHFTCAVALNIADLGSNNWGDWGLCRAQTITIATTCYHLDHWLKMYQMLVLQPSLIVNFMLRLEYLWVSWSLGGCKFQKKKKLRHGCCDPLIIFQVCVVFAHPVGGPESSDDWIQVRVTTPLWEFEWWISYASSCYKCYIIIA